MEPNLESWQPISGETPIDSSHLKDRSIITRLDLCKAEALNIKKAFVKYLAATPSKRLAPFDYSWLLRLHKEMYCDVWAWAGQLRQGDLNLGVAWSQVSSQVFELIKDLHCWDESGMPLLEQAVRLHYRAVWIHPFWNGNGRWARLLANIWLKCHKAPIVHWPEETVGQENNVRKDYLKALEAADGGDLGPLIALHGRYLK